MAGTATQSGPKKDHWSAEKYRGAAQFVPALTTKVMQYLDPQPDETILDIGCGDGVLTEKIAERCRKVVGLDFSDSMIRSATETVAKKHDNAEFHVADCRSLSPDSVSVLKGAQFDKAFSNAALHWILGTESIRFSFFTDVFPLIKPGGTFAFEMGGHGNIDAQHAAITAVLHCKYGIPISKIQAIDPWFFASPDWMTTALERAGFEVERIELEARPTKCTPNSANGSGGMEGWLKLMGAPFLDMLESQVDRDAAVGTLCEVLDTVSTRVEDDSQWLGYVRLRALARKPS